MIDLAQPLRTAIAREVRALFSDVAAGEAPVPRRTDGPLGLGSVAWRVHGDVAAMMTGGVAALLMQMLDPAVLAGVWDHSTFRTDLAGRLRRTARFVAATTFGSAEEVAAAVGQVRAIHARIGGTLPDGRAYAADDPAALAWVHVTGATRFLAARRRYAEPGMSTADQDRYFAEMAAVAVALGADPVPRSRAEAGRIIAAMRPRLLADARTRSVAAHVLAPPPPHPAARPLLALTTRAGVDLLPDWARRMHGLADAGLTRPAVRLGTRGLGSALRWALAGAAQSRGGTTDQDTDKDQAQHAGSRRV